MNIQELIPYAKLKKDKKFLDLVKNLSKNLENSMRVKPLEIDQFNCILNEKSNLRYWALMELGQTEIKESWFVIKEMVKIGRVLAESVEIEELKKVKGKVEKRRITACLELSLKYEYRRAFSETKLLESMGMEIKQGVSYNFITGGDVDGLSYIKVILLHQNINHCLFSTWCMAAEDILQIEQWVEQGRIKKIDAYLGEIFPNTYKVEWKMLKDLYDKYDLGRICVFKNHSKIFAGIGDKFDFGIQTSANINTNPRTENGNITINKDVYHFYKEYFDGINSFEKDPLPFNTR